MDADWDGDEDGEDVNWAKTAVPYVSWGNAARFANWMHNGQPTTGVQDLTTTEDGAYFLDGATSDAALMAVSREADWQWALPTVDEWYKAAYHQNNGDTGDYNKYPTQFNKPSNDLIDPDPGNNATYYDSGFTSLTYTKRTKVGDHENSESPYGTFDQAGNVCEWNEAILVGGTERGARGGAYNDSYTKFVNTYAGYDYLPTTAGAHIGFRLVSIYNIPDIPEDAIPGDVNFDYIVDAEDAAVLAANWLSTDVTYWVDGDFNDDGIVDDIDATILATNWGDWTASQAAVPEPGSIALLLCGLASLICWRRWR